MQTVEVLTNSVLSITEWRLDLFLRIIFCNDRSYLILPRYHRVIPRPVALDEAMQIFKIEISAGFPLTWLGLQFQQRFAEARSCQAGESAFGEMDSGPVSISFKAPAILSSGMRADRGKRGQTR